MAATAKPLEAKAKPLRSQFATDDDYIEALSNFKANEAIAVREQQQAAARIEAEQAEIAGEWSKRQETAMKNLPDYADVIGKSAVDVPSHVHQAILESEQGPEIAYYLALHPSEAKRITAMKPIAAIKRIAALERDLAELEHEEIPPEVEKTTTAVQKSKAPPPIEPVRSVAAAASASSSADFESYRRKRQAEQRK